MSVIQLEECAAQPQTRDSDGDFTDWLTYAVLDSYPISFEPAILMKLPTA